MNICPNISVKEIVCPHVYGKWGDKAIRFIDPNLRAVLDVIRNKILKCPITINNSTLTQRGLRCNCCSLVAEKTKSNKVYLSAHNLGKGCDFSCSKYTVQQIHELIKKNWRLLPCKIRLESPIDAPTWVHVDVMTEDQQDAVYVFRA